MTVKELIRRLVECPMDATVVVEIPTQEGYKYSTSENVNCIMTNDNERCLIYED